MRHTHRCPEAAATEACVQSEVDVIPTEMEWEMVCMDLKVPLGSKTIVVRAPAQHSVTEYII